MDKRQLGALAAVLLTVWGAIEFFGLEHTWNAQFHDPYVIGAQQTRFAGVRDVMPADAISGYITDLEPNTIAWSATFNGAQYVRRAATSGGGHESGMAADEFFEAWGGGCAGFRKGERLPNRARLRARSVCTPQGGPVDGTPDRTSGCAYRRRLAYRFGGLTGSGPRWAQVLLVAGAGVGLGIGITGCVFFIGRTFVPSPYFSPGVEIVLAAWLAWEVVRMPRPSVYIRGIVNWMLALGFLSFSGLRLAHSRRPGAKIRKVRGMRSLSGICAPKFLVSPDGLAARAWSPLLKYTHPEYPMLLPSFIARGWAYSGSISEVTPIATSFLFFLGMVGDGRWRAVDLALPVARFSVWADSQRIAFFVA